MFPRLHRFFLLLGLLPILTAAAAERANDAAPLQLGSRRELFVDDFLIDRSSGVELKRHSPTPAGVALAFDKPWEGTGSTYVSVFRDSDRYRMYYRGSNGVAAVARTLLKPGETLLPEHLDVVCYAESSDGIHWIRPSLGLFEFQGSKENNIVWTGLSYRQSPGSGCFMAFWDRNPAAPASQQYKALASGDLPELKRIMGLVSADGISWKPIRSEPVISQERTDWGAEHGTKGVRRLCARLVPYWSLRTGKRPASLPRHLPRFRPLERAGADRYRRCSPGTLLHQRGYALFSCASHLSGLSHAPAGPLANADPGCPLAGRLRRRLHEQPGRAALSQVYLNHPQAAKRDAGQRPHFTFS